MISSELIWLIALLTSHFAAYYMGTIHATPESPAPSNEAWLAAKCHEIDRQFEFAKWVKEREQAGTTSSSSDL